MEKDLAVFNSTQGAENNSHDVMEKAEVLIPLYLVWTLASCVRREGRTIAGDFCRFVE